MPAKLINIPIKKPFFPFLHINFHLTSFFPFFSSHLFLILFTFILNFFFFFSFPLEKSSSFFFFFHQLFSIFPFTNQFFFSFFFLLGERLFFSIITIIQIQRPRASPSMIYSSHSFFLYPTPLTNNFFRFFIILLIQSNIFFHQFFFNSFLIFPLFFPDIGPFINSSFYFRNL